MKPKSHVQGKIVIENDPDGDIFIMFPDGQVTFALDRGMAERIARKWLAKTLDKNFINIGLIEWRGF